MAKEKVFDLRDIHLVQVGMFKSLIEIDYELDSLIDKFHGFRFCFGQNSGVHVEDEAIRVRLKIDITALDKDNNDLDAKIEFGIEFYFQISNFGAYVKIDNEGNPEIDDFLMGRILAISYSTSRGIVYTKTEISVLSGILLPVINAADLTNDSIEVIL